MVATLERADRSTGQLVAAAREGDVMAAELLVERFTSLVWSIVRRFRLREADAHDAVQTTWLRMVEHLGQIRDSDALPGWLATTARRECLAIVRRSTVEVFDGEERMVDLPDEAFPDPEQAAVNRVMADLLWTYVAQLPAGGRDMLVTLTAPDRPHYAEYARRRGMALGSVGPTRQRYLRQLRRWLEESGLGVRAWR